MTPFPYPCLVADVGGTNARFAVAETSSRPLSPMLTLNTAEHVDFTETVKIALAKGNYPNPRSFLLAVAGPVMDRKAVLTNAMTERGSLRIDGPHMAQVLKLDQGLLLNDFEALCLALPSLSNESILPIGNGVAVPHAPLLVIGAGTGLGVGALVQANGMFVPMPSEAGHAGFGPETEADFEIWPHLGNGRHSAEDLLSGRGLTRIYRAVASLRGVVGVVDLDDAPAAITKRAIDHIDAIAVETIALFVGFLGRFAGDMALAFVAKGGVFVGGGIAPRLEKWLVDGNFRTQFEAKAALTSFLKPIPTALITAPNAALQGLAAVAATPERFALNYADRCWC